MKRDYCFKTHGQKWEKYSDQLQTDLWEEDDKNWCFEQKNTLETLSSRPFLTVSTSTD